MFPSPDYLHKLTTFLNSDFQLTIIRARYIVSLRTLYFRFFFILRRISRRACMPVELRIVDICKCPFYNVSPFAQSSWFEHESSFVAAECKFYIRRNPSLACMTVCTFDAAFLFPCLGWRPTPLNSRFENSVMVVGKPII